MKLHMYDVDLPSAYGRLYHEANLCATYCTAVKRIRLLEKYETKYAFQFITNYDLNINTAGETMCNSLL